MTEAEFNRWYEEHCAVYPQTGAFVNTSAQPATMVRAWFDVLKSCDLADALAANVRMLSGLEKPVPATDRSLTPSHVAEICGRLAHARKAPSKEIPFDVPDDPADWDTQEIMRQLQACVRAGGDVHALAQRLMPLSDGDQPRYRCLRCSDTGSVLCWHPRSMRLAALGRLKVGAGCYSNSVRCSCRAGERLGWLALFNEAQWLPCGGMEQREVEKLIAFMADYKPANYERSFDEFNAAGAEKWEQGSAWAP